MSSTLARVWLSVILLLLFSLGCGFREEKDAEVRTAPPPTGHMVFASDARQDVLVESVEDSRIVIRTSERGHDCAVTPEIARAWEVIGGTLSSEDFVIRDELAFDPNRYALEASVAYVRRRDDGQFEIRYVEGHDEMLEVAKALDSILAECGLSVSLRVVVELPPRPR